MKRKVICFLLALFAIAIFSLGCGGGGGSHSNPASPVISGNAKISGKIVDSSNKPVKDLNVRLALVSNPALNTLPESLKTTLRLATSGTQTEFNTTTDSNGVYTFDNVPYGRYSLSANAGATGILRAVTADNGTSGSFTDTLQPFATLTGKVETNDSTPIAVYGAMVSLADNEGSIFEGNGYRSFTDSDGIFTLKYIPVETEYQLVTTLQGYEAVDSTKPTTPFTIPVSGLVYTEDIYPTYSMVNNPIKLKASVVNSFSVPATVTTSLTSSQFPLLVIAQDVNDSNNVFYNVAKEGDASCTLRITKASTYKICAIDSTGKESKREEFSVDSEAINQNKTSESPVSLAFESSTSGDKTVVVKKIELPSDSINENTLNYYNGYVSCSGGYRNKFSFRSVNDGSSWTENYYIKNSDGNEDEDATICSICGNYAVYCLKETNNDVLTSCTFYCVDATTNNEASELFNISSEFGISFSDYYGQTAFIPNEFSGISYSDTDQFGCTVYHCYAISNDEQYQMDHTEENRQVYALRMAKGKDGNCYVAALYSSDVCFLKIYNASNESLTTAIVTDQGFGPDSMDSFQVLQDADGNTLFYVEGTNGSSGTFISCLYDNSGNKISQSQSSNLKGCYIDSDNNMYRYNSGTSTKSVIKTKYSNSTDILDSSNDSSKVIESYDVPSSTGNTGGTVVDSTDGIIGFDDNSSTNTLTVFVY